jgi:hypothetical protein
MTTVEEPGWYGVRCVIDLGGVEEGRLYEERVTVWRADSFEAAIALALEEAAEYAALFPPARSTDLAQAYALSDVPGHGAEVFSLIRVDPRDTDPYLDAFFDTGRERQGTSS